MRSSKSSFWNRIRFWRRYASSVRAGIVYDAAAVSRILGVPCECNDPVPEARDGEVVIYYGGWGLVALRDCNAGKHHVAQEWDLFNVNRLKAEPGYYRINLCTLDSNRKNWNEQIACLRTIGEVSQAAPFTVAITALLVHLTETGNDLMKSDWCRCAEKLRDDSHVRITICKDRVHVLKARDDLRSDELWLASVIKC